MEDTVFLNQSDFPNPEEIQEDDVRAFTLKVIFRSGDIIYFHFDHICSCTKFADDFDSFILDHHKQLFDEIEDMIINVSDGKSNITFPYYWDN